MGIKMKRKPGVVVFLAATAVALIGCAARASTVRGAADTFSEGKRETACLDLRDHIVDLYADDYLEKQSADLSPLERVAFSAGWRQELAKSGTFDRFEATCFAGLTPAKFRCGMASTKSDALVACMKLSDAR
jgi:hypothetical protein